MERELSPFELRRALTGAEPELARLIATLTPVVQARVARILLLRQPRHGSRNIRQEVEDLSQDVLLVLFNDGGKVLRTWDPQRGLSLKNFAGLVTERHVTSALRSGKRNPWREDPTQIEELDQTATEAGPETRATSRDLLERLLSRLREELSPLGWHLFDLLFVQQLTVQETVERAEMSLDAVYAWRSRLRRRARALQEELTRSGRRVPKPPTRTDHHHDR